MADGATEEVSPAPDAVRHAGVSSDASPVPLRLRSRTEEDTRWPLRPAEAFSSPHRLRDPLARERQAPPEDRVPHQDRARRWFTENVVPRLGRGGPSNDDHLRRVLRDLPRKTRRHDRRLHAADPRDRLAHSRDAVRNLDAGRARGCVGGRCRAGGPSTRTGSATGSRPRCGRRSPQRSAGSTSTATRPSTRAGTRSRGPRRSCRSRPTRSTRSSSNSTRWTRPAWSSPPRPACGPRNGSRSNDATSTTASGARRSATQARRRASSRPTRSPTAPVVGCR